MQRKLKLLPAFQKIITGQFNNKGVHLSKEECAVLVTLISILEEEHDEYLDLHPEIKIAWEKSRAEHQ